MGTFVFDCVDCVIDQSNDRHYGGLRRREGGRERGEERGRRRQAFKTQSKKKEKEEV